MSFGRLLFLFGIAAVCTAGLRFFIFEGIYIASPSMEPTLPVGRHLFLDKTTFLFRDPRRGEVIAFVEPVPPHTEMVKRVIAIPGDEIEIRMKVVYINGEPIGESYVQHTRADERLRGDNLGPLKVPQDAVFVLGDNRDESNDSSMWRDPDTGKRAPFVPFERIRGRLRGVY